MGPALATVADVEISARKWHLEAAAVLGSTRAEDVYPDIFRGEAAAAGAIRCPSDPGWRCPGPDDVWSCVSRWGLGLSRHIRQEGDVVHCTGWLSPCPTEETTQRA